MRNKYWVKRVWFAVSNCFRPTLKGVICGHETQRSGQIIVFGKPIVMEMPVNDKGQPDYCLFCIAKMSIRCAWCGEPIMIGESITLYIPTESFKVPEYAVRYKEDGRCLIGCLRWDCAITGADMCGRWMPPGEVARFPSPLELAFGGNMVIVPDTSKYPDGASVIPNKV